MGDFVTKELIITFKKKSTIMDYLKNYHSKIAVKLNFKCNDVHDYITLVCERRLTRVKPAVQELHTMSGIFKGGQTLINQYKEEFKNIVDNDLVQVEIFNIIIINSGNKDCQLGVIDPQIVQNIITEYYIDAELLKMEYGVVKKFTETYELFKLVGFHNKDFYVKTERTIYPDWYTILSILPNKVKVNDYYETKVKATKSTCIEKVNHVQLRPRISLQLLNINPNPLDFYLSPPDTTVDTYTDCILKELVQSVF